MNTIYERIDPDDIDMSVIEKAGRIVRDGGVVAFPTETVYGLGADALCGASSRKIYKAKGRPSDNPLIIHIADLSDLNRIVKTALNGGDETTLSLQILNGTKKDYTNTFVLVSDTDTIASQTVTVENL